MHKDFVAKSFLFAAAAAYSQLLCELLGKYPLVSELHNGPIVRRVFFRLQFSAAELGWQFESCVAVCSRMQLLRMTIS